MVSLISLSICRQGGGSSSSSSAAHLPLGMIQSSQVVVQCYKASGSIDAESNVTQPSTYFALTKPRKCCIFIAVITITQAWQG